MNSNLPTGQHDLPKTYLRRFVIDPQDRNLKSMVYCYSKTKYEAKIKAISIDSKRFKKNDFYTIKELADPYAFENFFRVEVEPLYNKIMAEISQETNLTHDCRGKILLWLFFNKYRNEANRNNLELLTNFLIEMPYKMQHGNQKFESIIEEVRKYSKIKAKYVQLFSLLEKKLFLNFEKGMGTKHWIILKSNKENSFLTNDNPGFSVNVDMAIPDLETLNSFYATNGKASNYFILSTQYCLLISPFWEGTPLDMSLNNQIIKCVRIKDPHIDFINYCTITTRTQYLISNDNKRIERYLMVL